MVLYPISVLGQGSQTSTIVMDIDSGRILYENNANQRKLIASTTKILTAILVLENLDINKEITVGKEVLKMYGTNIYIQVGEKMKAIDLLYGLLLRSGNDAAVVLAIATSGSEENFVKLMNEKAQKIGMSNSTFSNPHGLDEETKNYSTAHDMALLSSYAYKNKTYREIVSTKKYVATMLDKTYLWYNRNKLLSQYKYCTGGKNGYTPAAGKTLVTTATKDGLNLTIVTLNDGDIYSTHKKLYEKTFSEYQNYTIVDKENFNIPSDTKEKTYYIKKSFSYPLKEQETEKIKTLININNSSKTKTGQIKIYLGDSKIGEIPIYQTTQKKKVTLLNKLKKLLFG